MTLETFFRGIIGDSTSPYTLPNERLWEYLDMGIQKLSEIAPVQVKTTLTITEADVTAGYIELADNITAIRNFGLGSNYFNPDFSWQLVDENRINFVESPSPNTYDIEYFKAYKRYDGETRLASYFDFPDRAFMGIIYYALASYQDEKGIINVDGATDFVRTKSEDGLSVTYGTMGAGNVETLIGHPEKLKIEAIRIFQALPAGSNILFSVAI